MKQRRILISFGLVLALMASACGDDDGDDTRDVPAEAAEVLEVAATTPPATSAPGGMAADGDWYRPAAGASWQWQLSGDIDTSYDVDVYDIDLFDAPAALIADLRGDGRRVICYFSAGSSEDWRDDVDSFADADLGEPLDGWDGERWLNVNSSAVLGVMYARLDLAVAKGCDGVEPDNTTAYRNDTGFDVTQDDQVAYNLALADGAHERGLAIGLKNGGELIPSLVDAFDFSVNEECHEYDECEQYGAFIAAGMPVFNAEYRADWADDAGARAELCARAAAVGLSTLVLPLDLDGSFRHSC